MSEKGKFVLTQDDSCHWYLINRSELDLFRRWVETADDDDYDGFDFAGDRVDGPHRITILEYEES